MAEATWDISRAIIDGVANHPGKLITLGVLGMEPNHLFTASDIGKTFDGYQTDPAAGIVAPVWESKNNPFGYCQNSLRPIGLVVDGAVPHQKQLGKFVEAYKINRNGIEYGLPMVGGFLGWELDNPNESLQRILGSTNNAYDTESRAPSLRIGILRELLECSGMSRYAVAQKLGITGGRVKPLLDTLVMEGVVEEGQKYDPAERIFYVSPPDFQKLDRHGRQDIRPETHAAYKAAFNLANAGRRKVTGQEFLKAMIETDPSLQPGLAWKRLVIAIASERAHFIEDVAFDSDARKLTKLSVSPERTAAVEKLVLLYEELRSGVSRDEFATKGLKIMDDTVSIRALVVKMRENSAVVNASDLLVWRARVSNLLQDAPEGLTVDQLYERIDPAEGRVTRIGFGAIITKLLRQRDTEFMAELEKAGAKNRNPIRRITLL